MSCTMPSKSLVIRLIGAMLWDVHSDYPSQCRIMPSTVVDSGNSQVENYRED